MRVLILDDSAVMRKIVEAALRQTGLELGQVLQAATGLEGLAALEKVALPDELLDLIVRDVPMPCLDGLGFLLQKAQRNLAPGVPVVRITADASDPHLVQAIEAGARGYISKPFTRKENSSDPRLGSGGCRDAPSDPVQDANRNQQTMMRGPS